VVVALQLEFNVVHNIEEKEETKSPYAQTSGCLLL
jgi:hypothetical protein